jgi:hypothetical protein
MLGGFMTYLKNLKIKGTKYNVSEPETSYTSDFKEKTDGQFEI